MKNIIKEAGIVILFIIVIALVLGIVFYEYIPKGKIIPVKIKDYNLSEDIKNELVESVSEGQNIVKTLYIDKDDLDVYESKKDYNKGKANPFADYTINETTNTANTGNKNNTTNSNVSSSNTNNENNKNTNSAENNKQNDTNKNEVYMNTPGKNY